MTALLGEAALLVNRAITASLRVLHSLSKAVTALMSEISSVNLFVVQYIEIV